MFNKVFKYDFKYSFRIWWIFAVATVGVSVVAGILLQNMVHYTEIAVKNVLFETLSLFGLLFCFLGLGLFPLVYIITSIVRYYTNFFSDEGYLTFTLPVKRSVLLNSKILSFFVYHVMTFAVLILDIFIFLLVAAGFKNFFQGFNNVIQGISETIPHLSASALVCLVFLPLYLLSFSLLSMNIYYSSLTFGAIIAKKHKVLAAIGIYFGIGTILSFIDRIIGAFTLHPLLKGFFSYADFTDMGWELVGFLSASTVVYAAAAFGLYLFNLHCLKNNLNLS